MSWGLLWDLIPEMSNLHSPVSSFPWTPHAWCPEAYSGILYLKCQIYIVKCLHCPEHLMHDVLRLTLGTYPWNVKLHGCHHNKHLMHDVLRLTLWSDSWNVKLHGCHHNKHLMHDVLRLALGSDSWNVKLHGCHHNKHLMHDVLRLTLGSKSLKCQISWLSS